jgi:hypothetical protein
MLESSSMLECWSMFVSSSRPGSASIEVSVPEHR